MSNPWTDSRIGVLREMWGSYPASQIAERLGTTRCAIIGKADRLGLRGEACRNAAKRPTLTDEQRAELKRRRSAIRDSEVRQQAALKAAVPDIKRGPRPGAQNPTAIAARQASRASDADRGQRIGTRFSAPLPHLQFGSQKARAAAENPNRETVAPVPVPRVDSGKPVRYVDLQPGQCKWIEGPTVRFHAHEAVACGAASDGPFCARHRERAYYVKPPLGATFDPEKRGGEGA